MDLNLMDKLRLLKIDTELRPQIKMKPMSRYYFITSTNPGEQFFVFVSTAAWLIRKAGKVFEQPQEEDDPNSTIANIIEVLREKQITVDFSSHKLKQGFGEEVSYILNILADEAMKKENFVWQKPVINLTDTEETIDDIDQVEDETEITLDKVEEEMAIYSEESEGEFVSEDDKESTNVADKVHDWEAWKLELERVAPALRLKITADGRDWRARHAQMKTYRDELFNRFKTTGTQLNKLHGNISSAMDKIAARENILNEQFEPLVKEYGALLDELSKVTNEYKEVSVGVTERQEMLNELTAKVENIKQKTESKGSSMNDNSPLVSAKKAVANLKKDIQELDFQIIVLLWLLTTKENPNNNNLLGNMESRMVTNEVY
ncbi:intraflagellar transport protein 57 homolog [Cydia pomonella]|uniref:intraflagellar transport protein 57 homolog n=1 Tax=Cydia pomonella TaxID=82600 RepID=UPI002ADDEC77|nr:intraflagellar transport protein 57 homolog [Cydia pomonella]XP_061717101.1 intraflagellar transport protein 57 homolog [Cydia pomonella]